MEFKDVVMQLRNYVVDEIKYKVNEKFDFNKQQVINLQPVFKRDILKIDKDHIKVDLSIKVDGEGSTIPFYLDITISGIFFIENWEGDQVKEAFVKNNTCAILFPFLRTLVANTTGSGLYPPYILPVVNIVSLFEKQEANK